MEDGLTGDHIASVVLHVAKDGGTDQDHAHHPSHQETACIVPESRGSTQNAYCPLLAHVCNFVKFILLME